MRILTNKLYLILGICLLLNLSCDEGDSPTQISTDQNLVYCLNMDYIVVGGDSMTDYADNNTTDQSYITITLESTDTDCETGILSSVSNAQIKFDWSISDESQSSSQPHLQTIPLGDENAIDIFKEQSYNTNDAGQIFLYWIDEGQSGCINIYCEYESDEALWTIGNLEESCSPDSYENHFNVVSTEAAYSNISYFTLSASLDTLIYNDLPSEIDSTEYSNELTLTAIVKDEAGVGLEYIPVTFINETIALGTLTNNLVQTNNQGVSENQLVNIGDGLNNIDCTSYSDLDSCTVSGFCEFSDNICIEKNYPTINITAKIIDEDDGTSDLSTSKEIIYVGQSLKNTWEVTNLDVSFDQELTLESNISISFSDTLTVQALDSDNTPVKNVPINFSLFGDNDIGYIENELRYTNDNGFAKTVFHITDADLYEAQIASIDNIDILINVSAGGINSSVERNYPLGYQNIIYAVDEFHSYPNSLNNTTQTLYAYPTSSIGEYQGIRQVFSFIVKSNGTGISGIPVHFGLQENRYSNGSIDTALAYTCCDDSNQNEEEGSDESENESEDGNENNFQLIDWNGDGTVTIDENKGMVQVVYNNSVFPDTNNPDSAIIDKITANIINPDNIDDTHQEEFYIESKYIDDTVTDLVLNTIPSYLTINNLDSTYCDTIIAVAMNNGALLKNIPITFNLSNTMTNDLNETILEDMSVYNIGVLTNTYDVTDSIVSAPFIAAKTSFCTNSNSFENIPEGINYINLSVDVQVQNNSDLNSDGENDNIDSSVILITTPSSQAYLEIDNTYDSTLPNESDNTYTTFDVTVYNHSGLPASNTLVQFESLDPDENPIGNIDTDLITDSSGKVAATFQMDNNVGLVAVNITVPEFGLATTRYITLSSTSADYIELIPPYPNEIVVEGGGGLESTDLVVEVKDGNGNLVSDPYYVYFELSESYPNNTSFNDSFNESGSDNLEYICATSNNGLATVSLNSGDEPGTVPIHIELYNKEEIDLIINGLSTTNDPCEDYFSVTETDYCTAIYNAHRGTTESTWENSSVTVACEIFTNSNDEEGCTLWNFCYWDGDSCETFEGLYGSTLNSPNEYCMEYELESVPITIVTGLPHSGQINYSFNDVTPIGGGLYLMPLSIQLEDLYTNPVQDSTNVYVWVEGDYIPWDQGSGTHAVGDTVKYGGLDQNGHPSVIDSLGYVLMTNDPANGYNASIPPTDYSIASCSVGICKIDGEVDFDFTNRIACDNANAGECTIDGVVDETITNQLDCQTEENNGIWEDFDNEWIPQNPCWREIPHPGEIVGEAKTGMLGGDPEDSYPGIAWTEMFFSSGELINDVIFKALTYGTLQDGTTGELILDSRDTHAGAPAPLPFVPGQINVVTNLTEHDFSTPFADDPVTAIFQATVTDYYGVAIQGGQLQCIAPYGNPVSQSIVPEHITDNNGQVTFTVEYDSSICTEYQSSENCVKYNDVVSEVVIYLLDPQQTASAPIEITLKKTQEDCDD